MRWLNSSGSLEFHCHLLCVCVCKPMYNNLWGWHVKHCSSPSIIVIEGAAEPCVDTRYPAVVGDVRVCTGGGHNNNERITYRTTCVCKVVGHCRSTVKPSQKTFYFTICGRSFDSLCTIWLRLFWCDNTISPSCLRWRLVRTQVCVCVCVYECASFFPYWTCRRQNL